MKRNRLIPIILFFSLLYSSLFCCCFIDDVKAEVSSEINYIYKEEDCCSKNTPSTKPETDKNCKCEKAVLILNHKRYNIFKSVNFYKESMDRTFSLVELKISPDSNLIRYSLLRIPRQAFQTSIPVYLRDMVLRI